MATVRTDLDRFRDLVERDEALQDELAAITDRSLFITRVVALAGARGLLVSDEEVAAVMDGNRRAWIERSVP